MMRNQGSDSPRMFVTKCDRSSQRMRYAELKFYFEVMTVSIYLQKRRFGSADLDLDDDDIEFIVGQVCVHIHL